MTVVPSSATILAAGLQHQGAELVVVPAGVQVEEVEAAPGERVAVLDDELLAHLADFFPGLGRGGGIESDLVEGSGVDGEGGDVELTGHTVDLAVAWSSPRGRPGCSRPGAPRASVAEGDRIDFLHERARDVDRAHLVVVHVDDVRAGAGAHGGEHLGGELDVRDDFVLDVDLGMCRLELGDHRLVLVDHRRVGVGPELDRRRVLSAGASKAETAQCTKCQRRCRHPLCEATARNGLSGDPIVLHGVTRLLVVDRFRSFRRRTPHWTCRSPPFAMPT